MRISDWSSDVCSSDLRQDLRQYPGVSGGGLIRIRASAKGRIKAIAIDDSLMVSAEKQMLEDLLAAAFNDARDKADRVSNEEMGKMTSVLPSPTSFKQPFSRSLPRRKPWWPAPCSGFAEEGDGAPCRRGEIGRWSL